MGKPNNLINVQYFFWIVKWVNPDIIKRRTAWFTYKEYIYAVVASIKSVIADRLFALQEDVRSA